MGFLDLVEKFPPGEIGKSRDLAAETVGNGWIGITGRGQNFRKGHQKDKRTPKGQKDTKRTKRTPKGQRVFFGDLNIHRPFGLKRTKRTKRTVHE